MEKKLFLLDGMALIYRAYFAFNQNPRLTSTGVNTSAAFDFTNTLPDISGHANGIYFIEITEKENSGRVKLIKY